jgi:glycosyltransferase involved in cell wall biosynthesis
MNENQLSIVIPAKNEAKSLEILLPKLKNYFPNAKIIISNDGSTDNTVEICNQHDVEVVTNVYSLGNGGAIKSGARAVKTDVIAFMDADGQHSVENLKRLIDRYEDGYDMVIGAREITSHAGKRRLFGNLLYNKIASIVVGQKIEDLTSGLRVVTARKFKEFLYLLPNGFSYPTTITMAFFRTGYTVSYVPIEAAKRVGSSHLKIYKDGLRFLVIIIKIAALYSPLKIFAPISALLFTFGFANYLYTFFTAGRFTNMSATMLILSVLILLMGLISEQITVLLYSLNLKKPKP